METRTRPYKSRGFQGENELSWNYRVLSRKDSDDMKTFAIHEVYYDEEGTPTSCTLEAVSPMGETLEELQADMQYYNKALENPVLDYDTIGRR